MKIRLFLTLSMALFLSLALLAGCQNDADLPTAVAVNSPEETLPEPAPAPPAPAPEPEPVKPAPQVRQEMLLNLKFVLHQVNGASYAATAAGRTQPAPALQFGGGFVVSGHICNRFSGEGFLEDDVLTVNNIASTRAMCADQSLNQLETNLFQALGHGVPVSMDGDLLTLQMGDSRLVFKFVPDSAN